MATRTLEQVMAELEPNYAGSRTTIQKRLEALPGQFQSELGGLEAKQQQAFGDILSGARRRGLGFSGIPLSEQAQYTSTEFLPAIARLKGQQQESQLTLEEALNQLGREQREKALGIQENELARELERQQIEQQQRQFEADLAFRREQLAQEARLAQQGGGGGGNRYLTPDDPAPTPQTDPIQQSAFNEVIDRINNPRDLVGDVTATLKSANYGNQRDKYKIEAYKRYAPNEYAEAQRRLAAGSRATSGGGNIFGQPVGVSAFRNSLPAGLRF